jgi:ADP-ribosylglycohydrolase
VNLGNDADTAGTIIGAIAGTFYGFSAIPISWLNKLQGFYPPNDQKPWNVERINVLAKLLVQRNPI